MKLDPCRKCGGKAKLVCEPGMVDYVKCTKCDDKTDPYFDGIEYAVGDWNSGKKRWATSE